MGVFRGTITRRMDSVFNGLQSEFKALCDIRDFESKLDALRKAGTKSDRSSKLRKLFDMFDMCGIEYERGRDNEYYEDLVRKSDIPTFLEIEDRMLYALYNKYKEYPSPEEYMRRIVKRLSAEDDHWETDTLRVKILKQFIKYGDYLTYNIDLFDEQGKVVLGKNAKPKQKKMSLYAGELFIKKYVKEKLGRKAKSVSEVLEVIDDEVFNVLSNASKDQKKPEGIYGLLRMVDDLSTGKFRAAGATKRSLYLFAMVYGMTYYTGGSDEGEFQYDKTDLEINLFRDYYTNNLIRFISDAYKGKLCEFELDPSGQGINYKNFAEMIYLYFISKNYSPQEKIRLSSEMIKKVQEQQFKKGKPAAVNAKIDSLYYKRLVKKDYSPQEKIRLSSEMINKIQEQQFKKGKPVTDNAKKNTLHYKRLVKNNNTENHKSEDILRLPETSFMEFICNEYNCDTFSGTCIIKKGKEKGKEIENKVGELQLATEQKTAYKIYNDILEDITNQGKTLEDCNYGLWIADPNAYKREGYKTICDRYPNINRDKFSEFMDLLSGINRFLGHSVDENTSDKNEKQEHKKPSRVKIEALNVASPSAVTRTSMIVAYYYYYNAVHENDENDKRKSFEELFNNFKKELDVKLEEASYQPLSGKNIFDVLVAFSSYAYLNL